MEEVSQQVDLATAIKKYKELNEHLKKELSEAKSTLHKASLILKESERKVIKTDIKDTQLTSISSKINHLKRSASVLRTEISANYSAEIPNLENEIKYLKNQLKISDDETELLKELKKKQKERLEELAIPEALALHTKNVKEEIKANKIEYREIRNKAIEDQHRWKELHEKWVNLNEKIKEFDIGNKEEKIIKVEENALDELNKKQKIVNKAIMQDEMKNKRVIMEEEARLQNLKSEDEILKNKLSEKEKEVKLKKIKIKELKNTLKQIQNDLNSKKMIAVNNEGSNENTFLTLVGEELQSLPILTPQPQLKSSVGKSTNSSIVSPEPYRIINDSRGLSKIYKDHIFSKPYLKFH
ncbi:unnamed protein product [Blepharisma stoltei]|uniref:Uncharacterized protein n=1 Tax=Blepharisma stoltei TaxID=1481888 RepID=A0AAU9J520_9CILI|nr:unnamed protein product [Blepharisma stoltei]